MPLGCDCFPGCWGRHSENKIGIYGGSHGGYGKEFLRAGFKQIGRKVMDDVEDGVKYAISQGWVNENKIGIYGGSHGGYATLMGLVKTPDLYACGVNYVGVSNIETLFKSIPEYWKPQLKIMGEIWYDLDNPEELKIAREVSAVNNVDKIKKPLLVVQGANDPRVNINDICLLHLLIRLLILLVLIANQKDLRGYQNKKN